MNNIQETTTPIPVTSSPISIPVTQTATLTKTLSKTSVAHGGIFKGVPHTETRATWKGPNFNQRIHAKWQNFTQAHSVLYTCLRIAALYLLALIILSTIVIAITTPLGVLSTAGVAALGALSGVAVVCLPFHLLHAVNKVKSPEIYRQAGCYAI